MCILLLFSFKGSSQTLEVSRGRCLKRGEWSAIAWGFCNHKRDTTTGVTTTDFDGFYTIEAAIGDCSSIQLMLGLEDVELASK